MNLQRYATLEGTPFIGREALMDTMGDLLTNTIGAVLMGLIAYFQGRGKPDYFESYRIKKLNSDFYQLSELIKLVQTVLSNDFAKLILNMIFLAKISQIH